MRKLIYQPWISLDGFAADANHSTKFFEDRKYGGESDQDLLDYMDNLDTILLGANTYKLFVDFWPAASTDTEIIADRLNSTPKIIFSKSLKEAPWGNWPAAEIVSTDAIAAVKKLKAQDNKKDMVLWGSISLARSFIKENLIDEFHVRIVPIVLGDGTPLFDNREIKLELFDSKQYSSGIAMLQYKPA